MNIEPIWISLCLYPMVLGFAKWLHWKELKKSPEKGLRYAALPLHYKAICWIVVCGSFSAMPIAEGFGYIGLIGMFLAEVAAVRWYRRNGYL